jgi:hypothetical protein
VLAPRDRGDVKDRVIVGQRVVASVVAERSLAAQLVDVDVAFQDEIGRRI